MTDQSIIAPSGRSGRVRLRQARTLELSPWTVYSLSGIFSALLPVYIAFTEGGPATVLLAAAVCLSIGACIALITRRLLVAVFVTLGQAGLISLGSWLKLKYMNMVLHAYDLTFHLTSATTLSFLWDSYRLQLLMTLAAITGCALLALVAYRIDPVRIERHTAGKMLMVGAAGTSIAAALVAPPRHSQFEFTAMHLSSFYRSWGETVETHWRGQLMEASATGSGAPLRTLATCRPDQSAPHVILVHHESVVPPSLFPQLGHDPRLNPFFQSDNGASYKLRVETYGGASVLTEFSVLTGLSTYSFGGMRQFVQSLMSGKVKETLPELLAGCGYRTTLFYPMLKSFTQAEKFFSGIGFQQIFDARDQKATRHNERDRFYYDNALNDIARQLSTSSRRQFTFVETMATHWPYDQTYEPHLQVPGGKTGTHPEMNEYLRRLWIAHADYQYLREELARRFPKERFLIVRYGDHHPMATRMLLGYGEGTEAEDVLLDRNSLGFVTFFAVNGVNYTPASYETSDSLDVPYLGTVLLQAAGLPMSEAYRERQRLQRDCQGLWTDCADGEKVLTFQRRLIDSGLVSAR